jgi:hypothetical protein
MTNTTIAERQRKGQWVQTERASHEAWAALSINSPKASALLHVLAANVGADNAVVASQKLLAKMMRCHPETVKRALAELVAGNWIAVQRVGGAPNVYVLNSRVVWYGARDGIRASRLHATVLLDADEQTDKGLANQEPLRQVPDLFPGERQLPSGPGMEPPSQPSFSGFEPDLPAIVHDRSGVEEAQPIGQIVRGFLDTSSEEDHTDV